VGDVYSELASQALRCVASGIGCKRLGTQAQKSNTTPIAYAHKKVEIQVEGLGAGEVTATASMLIAEFDHV
jgi:hypothetical protein